MAISQVDYFLLFVISYVLVGLLTPLMRKIALAQGVLDHPNSAHKSHKNPVPYLGGVAIVIGVVIVSYIALISNKFTWSNFWLATSILGPAVVMGLVGLWDDLKSLNPLPRLIGQSIAGTGVSAYTLVNSLSTGTLGAINSTYVVSTSQTVSAATVMNSYSDVFQIGTEKLGTGVARALSLMTDGVERMNIGTTGNITITSPLSTNQDIEITDATKGIILKSPNGTKYRVTVSNAGELTTTLI